MQLSEQFVKAIKPTNCRQEISDGTGGGLALFVNPLRHDGKPSAKTYVWRGRVGRSVKKITIGRVEDMNLHKARRIAYDFSAKARAGEDPHAERAAERLDKAGQVRLTTTNAFDLYMKREGDKRKSASEKWRMYRKDIAPAIGRKIISEVTTNDLIRIVNAVALRAPVTGIRTHALLSRFFNWSASSRARLETGLKVNPMAGVEKPADEPKPRDRFLSANEIKSVLLACRDIRKNGFRVRGKEVKAARRWAIGLEIILRTGARKNEIFGLVDNEIDHDEALMTLEADRFKGGRKHELPLPKQVMDLLAEVDRPNTGSASNSQRIFQRLGSDARLTDYIRAGADKVHGTKLKLWCIHDLRRTLNTHLAEAWDEEADREVASDRVIEAILGHALEGVKRHYNKARMLREKRRVLVWWNNWLDSLVAA